MGRDPTSQAKNYEHSEKSWTSSHSQLNDQFSHRSDSPECFSLTSFNHDGLDEQPYSAHLIVRFGPVSVAVRLRVVEWERQIGEPIESPDL